MVRTAALLLATCVPVSSLKSGLSSAPLTLEEITTYNRETRKSVAQWITNDTIDRSIFQYGLGKNPKSLARDLVEDTGEAPIQHDLISQLGARMMAAGQPLRYMEIGVSVLKGMYTQSNFFRRASLTGVDIEDPNPLIEKRWAHKKVLASWKTTETPEGQEDMRRASGRNTDYVYVYDGPNENTISYVAGDAFNAHTYGHIKTSIVDKQGPMNLVVSDGMHTGPAVEGEVDKLLSTGIIQFEQDKDFTMLWDDCHGEIYDAAKKNFEKLRTEFGQRRKVWFGKFEINGWVGWKQRKHPTCIFSTFDLSGDHLGAAKTWVAPRADVTCI